MGCINSKKDLSDNLFRVVHIDENSGTHWNGHLEISPKELILHRKGIEPTRWPLQHLRRYGFDSDVFTFEAGRRCPTGEGIFAFKCRRAENLFHLMQSYIQGIALNDDINQQLADMNLTSSSLVNRFNWQLSNSRTNNSIQNHNTNVLIPSNRQINANRSSDTFSADGNYLEPTPIRNNMGTRYSSGIRLSSIGSGPISPEPHSPGSPNSLILEVTQLNQTQHQQNYANSNIYHEFPVKSSESNNNSLNKKLSLDIPPQESAPALQQMTTTTTPVNCNPTVSSIDDIQSSSYNPNNNCSSIDHDDSLRMYVNVTPGEMENIRSISTPTAATSQTNFTFPKLSTTQSMDLSTRCYENLELTEIRTHFTTKQPRYSKPDIFAKTDVVSATNNTENQNTVVDSEKSEPTTPVLKEENRRVNYIVLDLDNMPSSNTTNTCANTSGNTDSSLGDVASTSVANSGFNLLNNSSTTCNNVNNNNQMKSITSTNSFLPLESPKNVTLGYATIDFNKTVALSNSTIPSIELDNEGLRRTRHSSIAVRQSNSTSD